MKRVKKNLVAEVLVTFFTFLLVSLVIVVVTFVFFLLTLKVLPFFFTSFFNILIFQELPSRQEREKMIRRQFEGSPSDIQFITTEETDGRDNNPRLARYVSQLATRDVMMASV